MLAQQRFTYLPSRCRRPSRSRADRWQVPDPAARARRGRRGRRSACCSTDARGAPARCRRACGRVLVNEGGHGFYRVRYARRPAASALLGPAAALAPSSASTSSTTRGRWRWPGSMPLTEYLDLTARFRDERDRNVWSVAARLASTSLNRLDRARRPAAARGARARSRGARRRRARLDAAAGRGRADAPAARRPRCARSARSATTRPCRREAAELYAAHERAGAPSIPTCCRPLIAILAHAGDARALRGVPGALPLGAATPQEEQRYLYALAGFRAAGAGRADARRARSTARSARRTRRSWCARC